MDVKRLRELITAEKNDTNSYYFEEIFEEKKNLLCENLQETMQFIDFCTQDEFYWISNAFEDISKKFKSMEFIECLRRNQKRFPEILEHTEMEIDFAIKALQY